jgi:hypothetical protein
MRVRTPWKRMRGNGGRGTSAGSRCMNASGHINVRRAISIGCLRYEHHLPGTVECNPFRPQELTAIQLLAAAGLPAGGFQSAGGLAR